MQYRLQSSQEQRGAKPKDIESESQNIEIYSTLLSLVSTEILFYPFETILHRLQLQGTRTIIDNLDSGYSVVPILTNYEGATDCYRSTIASEGVSGLYKGTYRALCTFLSNFCIIDIIFRFWSDGLTICRSLCRYPANKMDCYTSDGSCCK